MSKNLTTHLVSAAVVLAVGVSAGNVFHHQNVELRAQAHRALVAEQAKEKAQAEAKAAAAKLAAQEAAAKAAAAAKVKSVTPTYRTPVTH